MVASRFLKVLVVPRASKTEIVGQQGEFLKIKLKAAPVDNAANEELVRFLVETYRLPKSKITILSGRNSRRKLLKLG
jgi:uncharacterized protein (TIGR00251 family)